VDPDAHPIGVILDVDGTLVDSVYHHAIAWQRAFRRHGIVIPAWRLHRHVGMGGDRFVPSVAGAEVEEELGEALREAHGDIFAGMIDEVTALPGAREVIVEMAERGQRVALASSADAAEVDHYLDMLGIRDTVCGWTTAAEIGSTKPAPDVVEAALEVLGDRDAVMVGDATWDCLAAARAGLRTVCVATGGFGRLELLEAGAVDVLTDLRGIPDRLRPRGPRPSLH
jgi:HAD superfamily hydrolase (TIGR01509 family)